MALLGLSKVGTWVTLPPRGIGIILLSIIAGFSVASLVIKPWSKMTNWSEINQSSYRVAMEDGKMGSTGSIGLGLKERSRHSTASPFLLLVLLRNLHIHKATSKPIKSPECVIDWWTIIPFFATKNISPIAHRSQLSGAPIGDLSNGSASLGFDEPTAPAPTLPIPAVKVVKLLPVPWIQEVPLVGYDLNLSGSWKGRM